MILSDGGLKGANESQLTILPEGILELNWNNNYGGSTKGNDELLILLYAAGKKDSDCLISAARRGDGKCRFKYRQDFSGYEPEVFIGFTSAGRKRVSRSRYLGRVLL